ncbi:hypothetical protein [Siphonobacter sp. SORGH_AS_1065]|uniref:hypothetical protein n=1 Tax=Siphonobacter sp. SORGH_AS_1065 TaxID=3041795 RepID=UPI0027D772CF|nr:hypothetical protein [Siphonobacter sp. SORGH_AS_1065]
MATHDRNVINFSVPIPIVEKKIIRMNDLLDRTLVKNGVWNNYFFDVDSNLYINSNKIGKIGFFNVDTVNVLSSLDKYEKREMISIVVFLKSNEIFSTVKEMSCNCYLYSYMPFVEDDTFKTENPIYIYEKNKDYSALYNFRKKIDQKSRLILLTYKSN